MILTVKQRFYLGNPAFLEEYLNNQAALRGLSEAVIVDGTGQILAKSQFAFCADIL